MNVAVAWGFVWAALSPDLYRLPRSTALEAQLASNREITTIAQYGWRFDPSSNIHWDEITFRGLSRREFYEIEPSYFEHGFSSGPPGSTILIVTRAGWPAAAMGGVLALNQHRDYLLSIAEYDGNPYDPFWAFAVSVDVGFEELLPFPLRPILPGFIVNTLFYGTLLWLLICGPFALQRVLRRKRRLCEKCAYPVGVSPVCTECGAAVSRSLCRQS